MHTACHRRSPVVRALASLLTAALLAGATAPSATAAVVVFHGPPHPVFYPPSAVWVGRVPPVLPPPRFTIAAPPPRLGWTWVPAYWRWTGSRYVWVDGGWLAARPGFRFVGAHWSRLAGGWVFVAGGWEPI